METAGWATVAVGVIASVAFVLKYVLDQVPAICQQAVVAMKAIREAREALRTDEAREGLRESEVRKALPETDGDQK